MNFHLLVVPAVCTTNDWGSGTYSASTDEGAPWRRTTPTYAWDLCDGLNTEADRANKDGI